MAKGKHVLLFFQSKVTEADIQKNRKDKVYYPSKEACNNDTDGIRNCCSYDVGIAVGIYKKINTRFDGVFCACDEFPFSNQVKKEVKHDFVEKYGLVTNNNYFEIPIDDPNKRVSKICFDMERFLKPDTTLYIAVNGGDRKNMMVILTFIEIMSCRGINTRLFYADRYQKDSNKEVLLEMESNMYYFELLRGVELFTETGNPSKLKTIYESCDNKYVNNLLNNMELFYHSTQICRKANENGLVDIYKKLVNSIDELNKYIPNDDEETITVFKTLLPMINFNLNHEENGNDELVRIVKWCLNNKNISLGYFILDTELVSHLLNKKVFYIEIPNKETEKNTLGYEINYTDAKSDIEKKEILIRNCVEKLTSDGNINKYKVSDENKRIIINLGFRLCSDVKDDFRQLKKILMIITLVRRIRNSIAHSYNFDLKKDYDILYGNACLKDIIDSYEPDIMYTDNSENKKLINSSPNYLVIIRKILSHILSDIDDIIQNMYKN